MEKPRYVIEAAEAEAMAQESGLSVLQLLPSLVKSAQNLARPPISKYHVGAVGLGSDGRIFLGGNLEFPGLPLHQSVHAEQFLVTNAAINGEPQLQYIAVSSAPCGHCRQFLQELRGATEIKILITSVENEGDNQVVFRPISYFLPHRFGPDDLLDKYVPLLLEQRHNGLILKEDSMDLSNGVAMNFVELKRVALEAANQSHAPYSNCPSGVAVMDSDGKVYSGSYIESAAYNPSMGPVQAALVAYLASGGDSYSKIVSAVLVEKEGAMVVQEALAQLLLLSVSPRYKCPLKPPTPYELSTWILKEEVKNTDIEVNKVKATWPSTGVTIMSDGWKYMRGRQLINFLVNSPEGTVFLKSVDASDAVKNVDLLFKMFDEVIQEVGPENVVQLVSDNASNYVAVGKLEMAKYKHMNWTPCAAHYINLMISDLYKKLPQLNHAYLNAKVTNFIYNHGWVLALMRKYTKKDLLRPVATRFGTAYLTLNSIFQPRAPLEQMFTCNAWAKTGDGKAIRQIVLKDKNFWPGVVYALKATRPLVKVLRLVDSYTPSMGHLYGAMDKAKEDIARNLDNEWQNTMKYGP